MLSILVGHSYFLRFDRKQLERAKPYPPLATLQVASRLRRAGHAVALFDAMLADDVAEFRHKLATACPQLVLLYEDNFNFLSKMCLARMRRAACEMIALARSAGARVVAAGADASDAPEPYLRAGADVTLKGEGLGALLEVVRRLERAPHAAGAELAAGLPGAAALDHGRVSAAGSASPLPSTDPDEPAAWDLVDMDRYRDVWLTAHGYFSLNMAASRGCSFRCAWCAKPIWGNQYLQREAGSVAREMAYLRNSFGVEHVWFADDIFGFRVPWVNDFTAAAGAAGGGVPFTIQTRADLVSERMATALGEAGCREAWIGAESGSQRILDSMNKGTKVEEITTARARLKAVGVRVGFFIQLGYLGEELEDILATRSLLEVARPDDVGVSVSYPLPGTRFYEIVKAQLGSKTRWQDSDDLAMMFQGTYTSEFYRVIRDLLHDQISLQGLNTDAGRVNGAAGERRALERRWQELIDHERHYRTHDARAAAI